MICRELVRRARKTLLVGALALAVLVLPRFGSGPGTEPGWGASPAAASDALTRTDLGDRSYLIDLPRVAKAAPILIALHGWAGIPANFAQGTGLADAGTDAGYAVLFPKGSARRDTGFHSWNAGNCCGYAFHEGVDDMAFLDAVIADAATRYGLDSTRVYITGISNGGMLAARYAALRPDKVRAVALVAATLDLPTSAPRGFVPFMDIHGDADDLVPLAGGLYVDRDHETEERILYSPVADVIAAFGALSPEPLSPTPVVGAVDGVVDGVVGVTQTDWRDPEGRTQMRLIVIAGGGHDWPGARGRRAPVNATDEVLRFFAEHP